MTAWRSPLVAPVLFWIAGLILGKVLTIPFFTILLLITLLIICRLLFKNRPELILILIFLLGIFRYQLTQIKPDNHITRLFSKKEILIQPITGTVCSEGIEKGNMIFYDLDLNTIAELPVTGKIRFISLKQDIKYGDMISTTGMLSKIRGKSNPFAFDYKEFLHFKGIFASGIAKRSVTIIGSEYSIFKKATIWIRKFIRERIEKRCPSRAGFLKAIMIGDRSDIEEIRGTLTRAGLSHILAVSGLHVALIALTIFTILKIFVRHRVLLRIITIGILILYGAVCDWSPSVSRAVIMISLYFTGQILQKKTSSVNILFCSLLIITAVSPAQLFSAGLQLSFCAVLVLLKIIPLCLKFMYKIRLNNIWLRKIIVSIFSLVLVSLILSIFLSPVTLYYFNQFNLNGMIGNILGIPLITIILPLSILLILLPPVQFLVGIYQSSLELVLSIFEWWSKAAASVPLHFTFIPFSLAQVIWAYLLLISIFWAIHSFRRNKLILITLLLIVNCYFWIGKEGGNLKVIFFNCGLGDLCFIETPEKEKLMIDCGPIDKDPDAFKRSTLPYFQRNGIKKIDWLIITHAHNDHFGGLDDVLKNLEVINLLVTDDFQNRDIWARIGEMINNEGANIITVDDTMHVPLNSVSFKILHPDARYTDDNINNMSIVARLDYKEMTILFNGDLEQEGEEYLISRYPHLLDCDVTKVGHHGSKTSSSERYIELISPRIAVISTSVKNRFDFPHAATLQKYSFLKDNLIITGRDGAFIIESDGINFEYRRYNEDVVER